MSKHTPGPWKAMHSESYGACNSIYGPDKQSVANLGNARSRSTIEMEANAQLIAAAPDLLEACQRALREIKDGETTIGLEEDLIAAIAKAEGK